MPQDNSASASTSGYRENPPPPYTLMPSSVGTRAPSVSSSLFSAQISSLRDQIRQQEAARFSAQDRHDYEILSLLIPHVEALFESIAAISPSPSLVEATLVPGDAVDKTWSLSDVEGNRSGNFTKLIRVEQNIKTMDGNDKRMPAMSETYDLAARENDSNYWQQEKDERTERKQINLEAHLWWWLDEEMARRLAAHLQPARESASLSRQTDQVQFERSSRETKKTGRWSLFKRDTPHSTMEGSKPIHPSANDTARSPTQSDDISMMVNAEETTFRRQTEMGLWESRTGWGLVVRLRIRT
ncbi:hypothetical protein E4U43_008665 [Claviceps pusilla]|uniref:Uncharacterized protein n=1 Tax=Claviceps pusilla TaxID=123648 RepID=A0A9P7NIS3_9HYPO|nr:hypothetical protein E4U43_008665 [Claviceps pusilla]